MSNKKKILFDEKEDEGDDETTIKINKNYADRYENWRSKEEFQKCNLVDQKLFSLVNY